MRVDHPFILGFCQHLTFYMVFIIIFFIFLFFWAKPTFFNYCLILIVVCVSDSNMGDPKLLLLLFHNRTLISKQEPVLVVRSSQGRRFLFWVCPG